MKTCFNCGVLLLESEKTCPSCGELLIKDKQVQKEIATTKVVEETYNEVRAIENKTAISKKIIISPDPSLVSDKNKYILLIIISIIPILNLVLLPVYIFNMKNEYELRNTAKKIFVIVTMLTILIFIVITQYNLKTVYLKTKDFYRVIVKSFLGK
ncbi:hypothetical protein IMX26_09340 [Clostridium sp. 'deep sea']|uniref:hypothetical protein n=1 Tax=Clostridium sp. 'deep sea' TaxID=2779445 RepID=UPI0018965F67|nr:hypothetical protein [Clostridium sp. 'deep sea']QOR33705.1 hypothetical protein IMX26_09340 [Clostridium sp. 'deep sea']